jgi:hypothetical protein
MPDKNKKLFPNSYAAKAAASPGTSGQPQTTESAALTANQVRTLVATTAKSNAVRQAFVALQVSESLIGNQNARVDNIITGLMPLDMVGQRKIVPPTTGSMAVIAGGMSGLFQNSAWRGEANYTNRISEFNYTNQSFTPLAITLSTASRYGSASSGNLVHSFFYGGFAGKITTPTVQGFSYGTDTIDRYNRLAKTVTQISSRVKGPYCTYLTVAWGNLNKAFIPAGLRIPPRPAEWVIQHLDLGNNILQYGDNQIQRFTYNGEGTQVIAATLTQPRFGMSVLQGTAKTAFTFFGLNCYDSVKGGQGGFDASTQYTQGTQFDLDLETSTPITEFKGYGGTRYAGAHASSKTLGYIFGGADYTPQIHNVTNATALRTIFEFNFSTRAGIELGTLTPETVSAVRATASATDAYIFRGEGNTPNSYQFNFSRKDLTPVATPLVPQTDHLWNWFTAESDYSVGWGI